MAFATALTFNIWKTNPDVRHTIVQRFLPQSSCMSTSNASATCLVRVVEHVNPTHQLPHATYRSLCGHSTSTVSRPVTSAVTVLHAERMEHVRALATLGCSQLGWLRGHTRTMH